MYFSIFIASLLTITASLRTASARAALGINCRGSSVCLLTTTSPVNIMQFLQGTLLASNTDPSTVYNSGDHITCVKSNRGKGGFCLFLQGASLTLDQIRPLTNALLQHNCKKCGSVPIHLVDRGSNDPRSGILTINYVSDSTCTGKCIPANRANGVVVNTVDTGGVSVDPYGASVDSEGDINGYSDGTIERTTGATHIRA